MANKVLPSMLLGAAVAMGATTVFGLAPGTASPQVGTAGEETPDDAGPAPGPVALAGVLSPAVVTPVVAPPAAAAGAIPTPREQAEPRASGRPSAAVPTPRAPTAATGPTRRPVAAPSGRAPLVPRVVEGAGRAVGDTGRAVGDTGRAVAGTGREVVGGVTSGIGSTVDDTTGAVGGLLGRRGN